MLVRAGVLSLLPVLAIGSSSSCGLDFTPPTTEQICSGGAVSWRVLGFSVDQLDASAPGELPFARLAQGESAALRVTSRSGAPDGDCDPWIVAVAWRVDDPAVVEVAAEGPRATVTGRRVGQTPLTVQVTVHDGRTAAADIFVSDAAGRQRQPVFGIRVVP